MAVKKWAVMGCVAMALISGHAHAGKILVPAYFYPDADAGLHYWDALTAAAPRVSITAIMNPDNGPGSAFNSDYRAAVDALRSAGGQVVGYVHTAYGGRSIDLVKTDIDRYAAFYAMDGFFVDEMSNQSSGLAYYQTVYDYIKGLSPAYHVFGNPGISTQESYLSIADTLVTFEGSPTTDALTPYGYDIHGEPDAWARAYPAERFGHLIYGVADAGTMQSLIVLAASRNADYVYITDDGQPNPWDTLPAYWDDEIAAVGVPEPATHYLFGAGLALAALARLRRAGQQVRRLNELIQNQS